MSDRDFLLGAITDRLGELDGEQLAEVAHSLDQACLLPKAAGKHHDNGAGSFQDGARNSVPGATCALESHQPFEEREELFRELTDGLPNLVWQLRPNGETTYVNRRWRDYFDRETGMSQAEWKRVVHPEDLENFFGRWQTISDVGLLDPLNVRLLRSDGEYRWFSKRARAIFDMEGKLLYWIFTATDIHAVKQAEDQLRLEEERLRMSIKAAKIGVWDYTPTAGTLVWDAGCRAAFGVSPDAPVDYSSFLRAIHPDDRERVDQAVEAALDPKGDGKYEADFRAIGLLDGLVRLLHVEGRALFGGFGPERRAIRFIGIVQDYTNRSRTEDELRHANTDLQQFAYAAAHDLQEPLRNISLSLGLLRMNHLAALNEPALKLVETSIEGAQRIHGMVTDLLAFTRVTTHGIAETCSVVDANDSLERAKANLQSVIEESGAVVDSNALPTLLMHEVHLVQLFQNIIGNAIKYRKPGESPRIQVTAECRFGHWQISIRDNGIGFEPVHKDRIFGIFKRLHHRHQYPGSGIGLALCARIVNSYGGRIWAEGELGNGATFSFTLPLQCK